MYMSVTSRMVPSQGKNKRRWCRYVGSPLYYFKIVRPLLPKEDLANEQSCVRVNKQSNEITVGKDRSFTFDHVFNSKSSQEKLFGTCIKPLVDGIFNGYNATVFAYGQTGSGKTYTMGGDNISVMMEEDIGIIPRAVSHMYSIMQSKNDVTFTVSISCVEIYKEELRDLLDLNTSSKDMHIRENKGHTMIVGAREVQCETVDEIMSLVEVASAARHTGSTQMNEYSSRSHAIFTVLIGQSWTDDGQLIGDTAASTAPAVTGPGINDDGGESPIDDVTTHFMSGKFHFVDLAGSERAHRTGNVGDRFKESIHINTGLLGLSNVISALADPKKKATHIPYRDSKITRLLKDSLGGNAETVMICCISPVSSSFDETLNALKYANRAKNIKNNLVVNRDLQSTRFEQMQTEIKTLRGELAKRSSSVSNGGREISVNDGLIKDLENRVTQLQTECSHYWMIVEGAHKHLVEIHERAPLTASLDNRLGDWLELINKLKNKVPLSVESKIESMMIQDLKQQLYKCEADLKSDEEIFAEKAKEMGHLTEKIELVSKELERKSCQLEKCEETCRQREQQLLDQQMTIDQLHTCIKGELMNVKEGKGSELLVTASAPMPTVSRHTSVPTYYHKTKILFVRPPSRHIHTSPALYSLERVMQGFRAHTQLLVNQLEDHDDVLQHDYSDCCSDIVLESCNTRTNGTEFVRKGTYRVKKGCQTSNDVFKENTTTTGTPELTVNQPIQLDAIKSNNDVKRQIKRSQIKILSSNRRMRDLAVNIKMKEELIKELVQTGKNAETMNKQYAEKIKALEQEKQNIRHDMVEMQRAIQDLNVQHPLNSAIRDSLNIEYHEKLEATKAHFTSLYKKQKDTERVACLTSHNQTKIQSLEDNVDRMKKQSEALQKKLREETERKIKLEREMQKDHQKIQELESKNEKQQKVLKRKNEEIAAAQRKLRNTFLPPINNEESDRIEEQRRWLDSEMEKVIEQRRRIEFIEAELERREDILTKKELLLAEKSELEMKKLRLSETINKDLLRVSMKLESTERKIEDKCKELIATPTAAQSSLSAEIERLKGCRDSLMEQKKILDGRLKDGLMLSEQQERRLIEVEEAIETLNAAIEYKNDAIQRQEQDLRQSYSVTKMDDSFMHRLSALTAVESRLLLIKYWEKVIVLRENERKAALQRSEIELKIDEKDRLIRELHGALQRSGLEADRMMTTQQKEHEQKLQILIQQFSGNGCTKDHDNLVARLHKMEKDVYYYRKTSRELKQKVRDLIGTGTRPHPDNPDVLASQKSTNGNPTPPLKQSHNIQRAKDQADLPTVHSTYSGIMDKQQETSNQAHDMLVSSAPSVTVSHLSSMTLSHRDVRVMSEEEIQSRRRNLLHDTSSNLCGT